MLNIIAIAMLLLSSSMLDGGELFSGMCAFFGTLLCALGLLAALLAKWQGRPIRLFVVVTLCFGSLCSLFAFGYIGGLW